MRPLQMQYIVIFMILIDAISGPPINCNHDKVVNGSHVECRSGNSRMKCDPFKEEYFHYQAQICMKCEFCLIGWGKIPIEEWDIGHYDPEMGPPSCKPCRPCALGTYSDVRAFKCKPCTNCSLHNQHEVKPCTSTSDSVCDGIRNIKPVSTITTAAVFSNITPDGTTTNDSGSFNSHPDIPSKESNDISTVGMVTLAVIIIILIMLIVYLIVCKNNINCLKRRENKLELQSDNKDDVDKKENTYNFENSTSTNRGYTPGSSSTVVVEEDNKTSSAGSSSTNITEEDSKASSEGYSDETAGLIRTSPSDLTNNDEIQDTPKNDLSLDGGGYQETETPYHHQRSYPMDGKRERDYFLKEKDLLISAGGQMEQSHFQLHASSKYQKCILNQNYIMKVSKFLVEDRVFINIGRALGLKDHHIAELKHDNRHESGQEQAYQTLLAVQKLCKNIEYSQLKEAIVQHNPKLWEVIESEVPLDIK